MKKMILGLLVLLFICREGWAVEVKVWHQLGEGVPSMIKAEGDMVGAPEAVWSSLIRFNDFAQFMPRVVESFYIPDEALGAIKNAGTTNANKLRSVARRYKMDTPRKEGGIWEGLVFMVIDTPFPVENRWYVIRTRHDETKAVNHIYQRCWKLVTGNIDSADGCWTLKPASAPNRTTGYYQDAANPGGHVPKWMVEIGATQTIPDMFKSLEKEVVRLGGGS